MSDPLLWLTDETWRQWSRPLLSLTELGEPVEEDPDALVYRCPDGSDLHVFYTHGNLGLARRVLAWERSGLLASLLDAANTCGRASIWRHADGEVVQTLAVTAFPLVPSHLLWAVAAFLRDLPVSDQIASTLLEDG